MTIRREKQIVYGSCVHESFLSEYVGWFCMMFPSRLFDSSARYPPFAMIQLAFNDSRIFVVLIALGSPSRRCNVIVAAVSDCPREHIQGTERCSSLGQFHVSHAVSTAARLLVDDRDLGQAKLPHSSSKSCCNSLPILDRPSFSCHSTFHFDIHLMMLHMRCSLVRVACRTSDTMLSMMSKMIRSILDS